jgi:hypothetical protein
MVIPDWLSSRFLAMIQELEPGLKSVSFGLISSFQTAFCTMVFGVFSGKIKPVKIDISCLSDLMCIKQYFLIADII